MNINENRDADNKTKQCTCHTQEISRNLNRFTNPYAFKYPDIECDSTCEKCIYDLANKEYNKENLSTLCDKYKITPKYANGDPISNEIKIEIMSNFLDKNRTLFCREEERIIFTEAFRRLQYKTQVMVNSCSDDQRTRLLHSLEVQKISRKLAMAFKANYELCETIAIAHDIGHAPFGHAGEMAIDNYLQEHLAGRFSHALQGVKIVDFLCSHRALKPKFLKGLGISDYVLEGILKHDSDSFLNNISTPGYRLQYDCSNLLGNIQSECAHSESLSIGGIESQIVCWADKIAYKGHDWEEFVEVGLLEKMLSRINDMIIKMSNIIESKNNFNRKEKESIANIICSIKQLGDYIETQEYSSSDYVDDKQLLVKIAGVIDKIENNIKSTDPEMKLLYFSKEQYRTLLNFFKISRAWMVITKTKPKFNREKFDVVFIFYNYLINTTAHRIVPKLVDDLIESCQDDIFRFANELNPKIARENFINKCNEKWNKKKLTQLDKNNEDDIKDVFRESFHVKFKKEYIDEINTISKFIKDEYIDSTRIRYMTYTANKIINKLFDFYYSNPNMLPLKQRNRIEYEIEIEKNKNLIQGFLLKYYKTERNKSCNSSLDIIKFKEKVKKKIIKCKIDEELIGKVDKDPDKSYGIPENQEVVNDAITLRVIADYISGMTDRMAQKKYNEICSSSTDWSKEYSERGTFYI